MNGSSVFSPPPESVVTPEAAADLPSNLDHQVLFQQGRFVERAPAARPMRALAGDDAVRFSDPLALDVGRLVRAERTRRIGNQRGEGELANDRPIHKLLRIRRGEPTMLASRRRKDTAARLAISRQLRESQMHRSAINLKFGYRPPRTPSVPIPKFARARGSLGCELRNQRDTSNVMILVPLLNPKFANTLAARS